MNKIFSEEDARRIGGLLNIDWNSVSLSEFMMGLSVELEHGTKDKETNVTNDDEIVTGKIALAHLHEIPDYYTRLKEMETKAES